MEARKIAVLIDDTSEYKELLSQAETLADFKAEMRRQGIQFRDNSQFIDSDSNAIYERGDSILPGHDLCFMVIAPNKNVDGGSKKQKYSFNRRSAFIVLKDSGLVDDFNKNVGNLSRVPSDVIGDYLLDHGLAALDKDGKTLCVGARNVTMQMNDNKNAVIGTPEEKRVTFPKCYVKAIESAKAAVKPVPEEVEECPKTSGCGMEVSEKGTEHVNNSNRDNKLLEIIDILESIKDNIIALYSTLSSLKSIEPEDVMAIFSEVLKIKGKVVEAICETEMKKKDVFDKIIAGVPEEYLKELQGKMKQSQVDKEAELRRKLANFKMRR